MDGKERIIIILCNVGNEDDCQSKKKMINIEKKIEKYIYCKWRIPAWHITFIIEHKINKLPY